jgi:hypothetical protein
MALRIANWRVSGRIILWRQEFANKVHFIELVEDRGLIGQFRHKYINSKEFSEILFYMSGDR